MKKNQRKKYRKGTLVHVKDANVLKNNFATWLPCQVFKVSSDEIIPQGGRYVWVDSYSKSIEPKYVTLTTRKQREEYYEQVRKENEYVKHRYNLKGKIQKQDGRYYAY